jgi:general secretion pathway protein G
VQTLADMPRSKGSMPLEILRTSLVCALLGALLAGCSTIKRTATPGTKQFLATIMQGVHAFEVDCGRFPTTKEGLAALSSNPGVNGWRGPYWDAAVPLSDEWGTPLRYEAGSNCVSIRSAGRDKVFGTSDDVVEAWTW